MGQLKCVKWPVAGCGLYFAIPHSQQLTGAVNLTNMIDQYV